MRDDRFPKVAFVAGTLGRGGAERQLFYALRALCDSGAQPLVLSLTRDEHWEPAIRDLGVAVHWFGRSHNQALRIRDLLAVLRKESVDVVQSAHFHTNLYSVAAARMLGASEIGAIRNDTSWSIASLGRLGTASLRTPRHLAVNSLASVEQAVEAAISPSRLTYLPNVVDTEVFAPVAGDKDGITLLTAGRLVEQKRHDRFIRVLRRVSDQLPGRNVRGVIVGEGPLHDELEGYARTLGLRPPDLRIVANPDMTDMYGQASVFLLQSDFEGTPNVVLEAMSSGLPVVAFPVGGVPELIVNEQVGVLAPVGDEDVVVAETLCLCTDDERRAEMGRQARDHIERTRSVAMLPAYLGALYRRAAAASQPSVLRRRVRQVMASEGGELECPVSSS